MQGKGKGINSHVCFPSSYCQIQRTTSKQYITKLGDTPTIIKTPLQEVMSLKKQLLQKAITFSCQRYVKLLYLGCDSKKKKKKKLALALIHPYSGQLKLILRLCWSQWGKIKAQTGYDRVPLNHLWAEGAYAREEKRLLEVISMGEPCVGGALWGFIESGVTYLLHLGSALCEGTGTPHCWNAGKTWGQQKDGLTPSLLSEHRGR